MSDTKCGSIKFLAQKFESYQPILIEPVGNKLASVALVVRNTASISEILFIERARNKNDPWSGQVAFPGGNKDANDDNVLEAAQRETLEEVGIDLKKNVLLGRIDDQQGRDNFQRLPLVISCFAFSVAPDQETVNNYEVGASFWVDLDQLAQAGNQFNYDTDYSDEPYPAIQLDSGRVLWGLTYRFVKRFFEIVE